MNSILGNTDIGPGIFRNNIMARIPDKLTIAINLFGLQFGGEWLSTTASGAVVSNNEQPTTAQNNRSAPQGDPLPFLIVNKASMKCIDVSWDRNDRAVYRCDRHDGVNQHWCIFRNRDGSYAICSFHNGMSLDISGYRYDNGAGLRLWDFGQQQNQLWKIEDLKDGTFKIVAKHSSRVLDMPTGPINGCDVVQWDWHGGDIQRWFLIPVIL